MNPFALPAAIAAIGLNLSAYASTESSRWKIELENRDQPKVIEALLTRNSKQAMLSFRMGAVEVQADRVALIKSALSFHVPANEPFGEFSGSAAIERGNLTGFILQGTNKTFIHGKQSHAFKPANKTSAPNSISAFQNLRIHADGRDWTLLERIAFHHVPAISLARIENSKLVETATVGVIDVESGTVATSETLFQAGSMGAPLMSILALKLAAQGRLDLNANINRYLKSVKLPQNALAGDQPVTVLDLLNGTTGFDQYKFAGYRPSRKPPTLTELLRGADPIEMGQVEVADRSRQPRDPGINGAVLQQVLSDAAGKPFEQLIRDEIFRPFRMRRSTYQVRPKNAALGHYETGELTLDLFHIYPEQGESGLWTTAEDFAKALCQVQLFLAGKTNLILPDGQFALRNRVDTRLGILGLIKDDSKRLYHGGATYGFFSNHSTGLTDGTGIVYMSNRNLSYQLYMEIAAATEKQYNWTKGVGANP